MPSLIMRINEIKSELWKIMSKGSAEAADVKSELREAQQGRHEYTGTSQSAQKIKELVEEASQIDMKQDAIKSGYTPEEAEQIVGDESPIDYLIEMLIDDEAEGGRKRRRVVKKKTRKTKKSRKSRKSQKYSRRR